MIESPKYVLFVNKLALRCSFLYPAVLSLSNFVSKTSTASLYSNTNKFDARGKYNHWTNILIEFYISYKQIYYNYKQNKSAFVKLSAKRISKRDNSRKFRINVRQKITCMKKKKKKQVYEFILPTTHLVNSNLCNLSIFLLNLLIKLFPKIYCKIYFNAYFYKLEMLDWETRFFFLDERLNIVKMNVTMKI